MSNPFAPYFLSCDWWDCWVIAANGYHAAHAAPSDGQALRQGIAAAAAVYADHATFLVLLAVALAPLAGRRQPEQVGARCPRCKQLYGPDGRCGCWANLDAEIAAAVARWYEPTAEELAEVNAWLDECDPSLGTGFPTYAQLDAALSWRQAEAERVLRDGVAEGAKVARRAAQAYRDARAIAEAGAYRVAANGDLLVKSRSRNQWHVVARQPPNGGDWSPITCSCEWGTKAHAWGPCAHQAFYECFYDAMELAIDERDAVAAPLAWAA